LKAAHVSFYVVALSKNYKNQFHILTVFFTDFITFQLQKIVTYVDPRILVKRIERGLEIPGLKNSLVKMMQDYNLQVFEVSLMANSQTDVFGQFVNGTVLHCYRPICCEHISYNFVVTLTHTKLIYRCFIDGYEQVGGTCVIHGLYLGFV
jgi:hypothetical protein